MASENYLKEWAEGFKKRIVSRVLEAGLEFTVENIPGIVREASFAVQSKKHPGDCPCYTSEPCHALVDLNCLLCNCPNYNANTRGANGEIQGSCRVDSSNGRYTEHPNLPAGRVWDCNGCPIFHSSEEVEKYLMEHLEDFKKIADKIKAEK
ncbi:hypothetical protein FJZ17_00630 [Candidatus Pacearchaeota archaeon]|nr:hypothetical protein [Candidatus Pacearchaeota archaeon]